MLWRSAWDEFRAHPVVGGGAGSFQRWWLAHRTNAYFVQDTHNLYAQTLGELGIVGGALLALFLGLPLVAAVRARWHPLAAPALGAYVAYLVHCIVDWDWQMPAVTLLALFAGAALVVAARGREPQAAGKPLGQRRRASRSARSRRVAAVVAFVGLIGNIALARSGKALLDGNGKVVVAQAKRAHRWAPWSAQALRDLGEGKHPDRRQARRAGRSPKRSRQGSRRLGDLVRPRLGDERPRSGHRCRRARAGAQPGRPRARPARASAVGHEVASAVVVGKQRHRQPGRPAEQHGARDRGRAEAGADLVERAVQHRAVVALERQAELAREIVVEIGDRDADQRQAALLDRRPRRGEQAARDGEDDLGLRGRVPERVRARRAREVREAQAEHDGPPDAPRCAQPARDAVDERDEIGVELLR